MNSSLISADGTTHLKILVLALLAGIIVMWVGINARGAATVDRSGEPRIERSISNPDVPRAAPPRTGSVLVV
jgi:hypothetical protein